MSDDLLKRVQILLEANTAKFESGMARAEKISTQSSKEMTKGFANVKTEMKQTQAKVEDFSNTLSKQQAQVSAMAKSYAFLETTIKSAFAGVSVAEITARADSYTELHNKLKLVVESQKDVSAATQNTFEIAQKTGASWGSAADVYSKFSANSKALAVSQSDVARLTETVAKATAMSGSTAAGAADALTQFGQALSAGKLQAEEFNSMQDNAAGVLDAMAKGLGITRGQLRQMMLQGQLTGSVIVESLLKASKSVDEQYRKTDSTVSQSWTKLNNQITKYVGEAATASNSSKALAGAISYVAENFDKVVTVMMVGTAFYAGTYIPAIYNSITAGYTKVAQLVEQTAVQATAIKMEQAAAVEALRSAEVTFANTQATLAQIQAEKALEVQRLKSQISDQGRMASITRMAELKTYESVVTKNLKVEEDALTAARQRATVAQSLSTNVGKGLIGILGGPIGLGITVASIAASYLLFSDNTEKATVSMDTQKKTVAQLREEFVKLEASQQRTAIRNAQDASKTAKEAYDQQRQSLIQLQGTVETNISLKKEDADKSALLFKQYAAGRISAQDLSAGINKLSSVTEQAKKKIDDQTNAVKDANDKYTENKRVVDVYLSTVPSINNANSAETTTWNKKAAEINNARLALEAYKLEATKDMQKMQREAEYRALGLGDTAVSERLKVDESFNYQGRDTESYREAIQLADQNAYFKEQQEKQEKKITEQKDLQLKSQEKANAQALIGTKQAQNMLRVYQSLVKAGLSDSQARYFTAEVGREGNFNDSKLFGSHKDRNNGYTNTGMLSWQKDRSKALISYLSTKGQLDDDGKILNNQASLDAQAEFLVNEVMNSRSYAKSKEALTNNASSYESLQQIVGHNFVGWDIQGKKLSKKVVESNKSRMNGIYSQLNTMLGSNPDQIIGNTSGIMSSRDAIVQADIKLKADQLEIKKSLYDDWQKLEEDNNDKIKAIREKFYADPTERDKLLGLQQKAYEKDIENWFKAQNDREDSENKTNEDIVKSRQELWRKLEDAQNYVEGVQYDSADYLYHKNQPKDAAMSDLQNQHLDDQNALTKNYSEQRNGIFNGDSDENKRSQELLAAHEKYLQAKAQLDEKYSVQSEELVKAQHQTQLGVYSDLLGQASNVWDSMTDMVKKARGENSKEYKAMFVAQKAMAIAQQIINTELAAGATTAQTGVFGIPASTMIRAMGYASVGLIASQTISGIAHGGLDYVPSESTYLLDEGERVLSPKQNKDLTGFLDNQKSNISSQSISVHQTINAPSSSSGSTENVKALAKNLEEAVIQILYKQTRQGRILSK